MHEIGHLFHIKHCIWFECMMNGSNSMEESDDKPMHFCPICQHKIFFALFSNNRSYFIDLLSKNNNNNNPILSQIINVNIIKNDNNNNNYNNVNVDSDANNNQIDSLTLHYQKSKKKKQTNKQKIQNSKMKNKK